MTVGQTVARGQLLAAAERLDRKGNAVPQGAGGRVIARVQKHYTARQSLTEEAPVYTGRSSVQTTLYLPWRSYTDEPEDPLTGITQTDWLPVQLGRLALPASLCRVTTWEQLPDTVQYSRLPPPHWPCAPAAPRCWPSSRMRSSRQSSAKFPRRKAQKRQL